MKDYKFDFIIVGSGAGGSTLAWELSKRGKRVLVLERGKETIKIGSFHNILNFYDCNKYTRTPKKSKEGVIIYRTFMGGGSTIVSTGSIVRSYEEEFKKMAHKAVIFNNPEKKLMEETFNPKASGLN